MLTKVGITLQCDQFQRSIGIMDVTATNCGSIQFLEIEGRTMCSNFDKILGAKVFQVNKIGKFNFTLQLSSSL